PCVRIARDGGHAVPLGGPRRPGCADGRRGGALRFVGGRPRRGRGVSAAAAARTLLGAAASGPASRFHRRGGPLDAGGPGVRARRGDVSVSFDRIAGQLPAGAFHLPLDRLAASLPEPGYLLIPQRLVLAQLAEGLVRAGWEVVGEQFPRHVLAMTDEELTRQLPDGQLVLPLDELVPQLPLEL